MEDGHHSKVFRENGIWIKAFNSLLYRVHALFLFGRWLRTCLDGKVVGHCRPDFAMEWRPNFLLKHHKISKAHVWIRLPGLSGEYWKRTTLLCVAVKPWKPLWLDNMTEQLCSTDIPIISVLNIGRVG